MKDDLLNRKFGKLTVVDRLGAIGNTNLVYWLCRCDCGNTKSIAGISLKTGKTKSCGCIKFSKNGLSKTELYSVWSDMLQRCYNKKTSNYKNYGYRGIKVCKCWKSDYVKFRDWAISNGYKKASKKTY